MLVIGPISNGFRIEELQFLSFILLSDVESSKKLMNLITGYFDCRLLEIYL